MAWTAIVTGVSRGLGAALFDQLHARGDRVVALGRSFTDRQRALAESEPDRVVLRQTDLAAPDELPDEDEFRRWRQGAGRVALVHNAAVVDPIGAIGQLPGDALARAVAVNLTAPMLLTNAFLAAAPAPGAPATVLFISSAAAHRLVDGWACYGAAKRGGEMFFDALAAQGSAAQVANVQPGVMDTDMQARVRDVAAGPAWFPERDRFLALHADGALPDPAQVARTIIAEHLPPDAG